MAPTNALGRAICVSVSVFTLLTSSMVLIAAEPVSSQPSGLRFEVRLAHAPAAPGGGPPQPQAQPRSGRLLVVLGRAGALEPRLTVGQTGKNTAPVLGRDVANLAPGSAVILDDRSAIFPIDNLRRLQPGSYAVQALLHTNPDLNVQNAPGDLYSVATTVRLDPASGETVGLELSQVVPEETMPPDSELVKYLKIRSKLLSDFHGRPIHLRAGVILPRDFARQPERRYPVRVQIGGYGERFTEVGRVMTPGSGFHRVWMAGDTPPMILIHLDGAGPLGDPYQVDSANHGPYGAAITRELIPAVEKEFRGIGQGQARFLDGGSTGGWVALALQIFYPQLFNGAWAFCPDSVDFRSFELVNIYDDDNAYTNRHGFERPAARDSSGEVRFTMRHECQIENVLGRGNSWTCSGGQWGAWNATYGPKGLGGRPVPLWDPITGAIDHTAAEHWKAYDLRRVLESNWTELGPKLKGKLHIWVGEADDYFLNNAVHRLDAFLSRARPHYEGSISYGPGQGHCWMGISQSTMMKQMVKRMAEGSSPRK
ncbi:MAG: alpha/beta hydrolase-fold protein [Isosphaerales bacterium]